MVLRAIRSYSLELVWERRRIDWTELGGRAEFGRSWEFYISLKFFGKKVGKAWTLGRKQEGLEDMDLASKEVWGGWRA